MDALAAIGYHGWVTAEVEPGAPRPLLGELAGRMDVLLASGSQVPGAGGS